jgi:hypothetical protein
MATSTPNVYPVRLDDGQRARLTALTRNGRAAAAKIRHAQVLLWSDEGRGGGRLTAREIGSRLGMHVNTVDRVRKKFALGGEGPALDRRAPEAPARPPKIDGRAEAHLIAIYCGPPPAGRVKWTLRLLAGEMTRRGLVTSVCAETVRRTLKKTS